MEVYILDSLFRRHTVVDIFKSLIWTERYLPFGDFELVVHSTPAMRSLFAPGTRLAINESYRVMTVESFEDGTDSDGQKLLTLKGRSIEAVLEDRVARQAMTDLITTPNWIITGTPTNVMTTLFDTVVRNTALDPGDAIPFLQPGSMFPPGTILPPDDEITLTQDPDSLYNAIKGIGELYDLGFRLVRNFDTSQLYFDVYSGSDRTTGQTTLPPVVFSPAFDNLQNSTEFTTIDAMKNVAYVFSEQGFAIVYAADADPASSGFDRQVLTVKAENVPDVEEPTPEQVASYLQQIGQEELAKNRPMSAFDGEINQNSQYKYGTHYNLGDLVEIRNVDGVTNNMRVTEQIFSSDEEGDRSYPTLTLYQYINTGAWLSWEANNDWADYETDPATWAQQA